MARRMLIDSTHPEETRVTVVNGNRLEEFDYETATKAQLKGNIYLAKVTRVEPSLQAAFVEYGGNRHGFLGFSEIHPDYYQIPVADRKEEEIEEISDDDEDIETDEDNKPVEELGGDEGGEDAVEEAAKKRRIGPRKQYKIQEVIKRHQVILIQVVKEERGNKGAALTSYLSLAGRYCVLMPNTSRGGGVSRKISNGTDRKRLKSVLSELEIPGGMSVIVRTAGAGRSKVEIRRDFDYIFKLWDDIRSKTLAAIAPALIHEEANLIKRSMRDLYTKDIEEIQVAGEQGYRIAKDFMKALIPSHAKKVQRYKDEQNIPLFQRFKVESQLIAIHDPVVRLRSGGSIVIHQTEALVAIDVNSGKAIRERHIDDTAVKTNLEAAEEVARQLRLRDLAGIIVIDFIDMENDKNDQAVERRIKEALRRDRARIQVGRISPFGLLEMSRQRLRPSLMEAISRQCPSCGGVGFIQSTESVALAVLRSIEEEGMRRHSASLTVTVPTDVALYILNHKRKMLVDIERNYNFTVLIQANSEMIPPDFQIERIDQQGNAIEAGGAGKPAGQQDDNKAIDEGEGRGKRNRRRRRGRKRNANELPLQDKPENDGDKEDQIAESENSDTDESEDDQRKRHKRGRRGGRRRRGNRDTQLENNENQSGLSIENTAQESVADAPKEAAKDARENENESKPRHTRRGGSSRTESSGQTENQPDATPQASDSALQDKPRRGRGRPRKVKIGTDTPEVKTDIFEKPAGDMGGAPEDMGTPPDGIDMPAPLSEATAEATAEAPPRKMKKARAKKAPAKRARKKAAARKPGEAQAAPKAGATSGAQAAATGQKDNAQPPPEAQAAPKAGATSGAQAAPGAKRPTPADEPDKPKRKGWWNRVLR